MMQSHFEHTTATTGDDFVASLAAALECSRQVQKVQRFRQLVLEEDLKLAAMIAQLERQWDSSTESRYPELPNHSATSSKAGSSQGHLNGGQLSKLQCGAPPCLKLPLARLNSETEASLASTSSEIDMDDVGDCSSDASSSQQTMEVSEGEDGQSNGGDTGHELDPDWPITDPEGIDNEDPRDALRRMQSFCAQFRSQRNIETPKAVRRMSRKAAALMKRGPAINEATCKLLRDRLKLRIQP